MRDNYGPFDVRATGWVRRTCPACGCGFEVRFRTTVEVDGYSRAEDDADAARQVRRLGRRPDRGGPCPECHTTDPRPAGGNRAVPDLIGGLLVATLLAVFALTAGFTEKHMPAGMWPALAVGLIACGLGGHLWVAWAFPVRATRASRRRSAELARRDRVTVLSPPDGRTAVGWSARTTGYALVLLAGLLAAAPIVYWEAVPHPANDRCRPALVGPGDEFRVGVDDSFQSIDGIWGGQAEVNVLNEQAFAAQVPRLHAVGRPPVPADQLRTESRHGLHRSADLWGDVTLPDDPALEGATIDGDLVLRIDHPVWLGRDQYELVPTEHAQRFTVAVSPRAAVWRWRAVRAGGLGLAALTVAGAVLAFRAANRRLANTLPPKVDVEIED